MKWEQFIDLSQFKRMTFNINIKNYFLIKNREVDFLNRYKRISYLYQLFTKNEKYLLTDKTKKYFQNESKIQINNWHYCYGWWKSDFNFNYIIIIKNFFLSGKNIIFWEGKYLYLNKKNIDLLYQYTNINLKHILDYYYQVWGE